jgi:hypothetical protein
MFKRHNPTIPLALECILLFLAVSVFSWGLQAKLSGYQSDPGQSTSAIDTAKLATEKGAARTVASAEDRDPRRFAFELLRFTDLTFSLQGNHFPIAYVSQPERWANVHGQYNLPDPNLMRRPPPALS